MRKEQIRRCYDDIHSVNMLGNQYDFSTLL